MGEEQQFAYQDTPPVLSGQRHFGEMGNKYKHDAQASVLRRK
jgi:hypothetical protein